MQRQLSIPSPRGVIAPARLGGLHSSGLLLANKHRHKSFSSSRRAASSSSGEGAESNRGNESSMQTDQAGGSKPLPEGLSMQGAGEVTQTQGVQIGDSSNSSNGSSSSSSNSSSNSTPEEDTKVDTKGAPSAEQRQQQQQPPGDSPGKELAAAVVALVAFFRSAGHSIMALLNKVPLWMQQQNLKKLREASDEDPSNADKHANFLVELNKVNPREVISRVESKEVSSDKGIKRLASMRCTCV